MRMMNFGCGPDIKQGWTNVDVRQPGRGEAVYIWDGVEFEKQNGKRIYPEFRDYDFILVNHVLCTMKPDIVSLVLRNLFETLKIGGKIQVIDMDLLKVFEAYQDGRVEDIPINNGSIDERLCYAISGYGTRLSLYTPERMREVLEYAGFGYIEQLKESEYDTRPKESLIVEATKS